MEWFHNDPYFDDGHEIEVRSRTFDGEEQYYCAYCGEWLAPEGIIEEDLPTDDPVEESVVVLENTQNNGPMWTLAEAKTLGTTLNISCRVEDVGVIMMLLENAGYAVEYAISPDFERQNEKTI